MSWPIPFPTVLIPFVSETIAKSDGVSFVVPPYTKLSSFIKRFTTGPVSSAEMLLLDPPIINSSKYPLALVLSPSA